MSRAMKKAPPLGAKVYAKAYKRPLVVRARNDHFAVCTRPAFGSVMYFVVDVVRGVRGTENLVFGFGAETDQECQEMLERLASGRTEVSYRNVVPLDIVRVEARQ